MSSNFITNQEKLLSDIINGILPKTCAVDILVGYFYYSGYAEISEQMSDKVVRILVGLDVDIMITKQIREVETFSQTACSREQMKQDYFNKFVSIFNDTDFLDSEKKIRQFKLFYGKLMDGTLEIRKTLDPCHAKMYLFAYNDMMNEGGELPGVVITGSSNLSRQGLSGRIELNARFNDKGDYEEGKRIFDELWSTSVVIADSANLEEWNDKVMRHIWYDKLFPPYLMYIRVLKEYFSIPDDSRLLTPYDITGGKFADLRYQTDAVQLAMKALENHNGAIIADVVGLGKSIIASAVARNLGLRTIIISPPHLMKQWNQYKDDFRFVASVFSSGKIEDALEYYREIVDKDEQMLIIIDEAHRIRNEYTQAYADLHNLCSGNKVLLLTATPFNNRPSDIYSLLKLFQIPSRSTLKTVENLGDTFRELSVRYKKLTKDNKEEDNEDARVQEEIKEISKTIRSIISPLIVRRSRIDLQEIEEYSDDLKRQGIELTIPEPPEELTYDLSGLRNQYMNTLDLISPSEEASSDGVRRYKAARYSPVLYIRDGMSEQLSKELKEKTGEPLNLLIGRQTNVSKFMRRLLVARFESSVAAFRKSLGYMIESSEHMISWVGKRNKIPIYKKGNLPDVDDFYESTDDGMSEITEAFERYEERGFFEIDMKYVKESFLEDIEADIQLLKDLRRTWFGDENEIREDPKLDSFTALLKKKLSKEPKRKIVVFSSYADTVDYLGEKLAEAGLAVMKYTSNDASQANKNLIRKNFDAGVTKENQTDDYKVLVATDAISEGYNLHRAGTVFNYDIPYNPTRVIQRIGRINRINKKMFSKLYIYNYFPTDVGEHETHTKEISTLKMAMIHAVLGEDTKALTKDEEVQAYFKERFFQELKKDEEASWDTPYRQLLNSLKGTEAYLKALEIPHRARTGRIANGQKEGVLLFGKKGNDYVFMFGTAESEPVRLTAEDALPIFSAAEDELPVENSEKFDAAYQRVKASLFRGGTASQYDKDKLKAIQKVTVMKNKNLLPKDYLEDLKHCLQVDALSGYEVRFINNLKGGNEKSLPKQISPAYLARQLTAQAKVDEGEEQLILSEEFVNNNTKD